MARNFQAGALRQQMARILEAAGSSAGEARQVADNLVMANLSGHDSHGIGMIPRYVESIQEGGLQPNAGIKVNFDGGAMLAIDGQHGYGQIVGVQAMELAMERAAQHGSCITALGNAHHLGRIGHFAEMAVARGLVSIHFVNVLSRPVVAAWGGSDGRFGTNPCCIGIPLKGRDPFVLDFATSRVAHNEGRQVPEGYLIDEHGRPTTDPGVVVVPQSNGLLGALLPFGEHKGYGMAIACELLGGALSGGGTWHRKPDMRREVLNGMVTILIDPRRLGTADSFEQETAAFMAWLKESPPAQGFDAVRIAGDPEREARIKRERDGVQVDDQTWAEIVAAGKKVGLGDLQ